MANAFKDHTWSRLALPAALVAVVALAMVLLGSFASVSAPRAEAAAGPTMYLDASAPYCSTSSVDPANNGATLVGSSIQVAVCLENQTGAPEAFQVTLGFNPAVLGGTEVADSAPALADNPDANDDTAPVGESGAQCSNALDDDADGHVNDGCPASGSGEQLPATNCGNAVDDDADLVVNDGCPATGNNPATLGAGWDCTALGFAFPKINTPAGTSSMTCNSTVGNSNATLTNSPGKLATLTYNTLSVGMTSVSFSTDGSSSTDASAGVGNCDAAVPNNPDSNCVNTTITVLPAADIQITKTAPPVAVAGSTIHYILTVTNAGPSQATNVNVFDDLKDDWTGGAILVDGNPGPCVIIPIISVFMNVASCGLGPMNSGDSHVIDIPVTTTAGDAGKNVLNSAAAGSGTQPGNIDEVPDPDFTPIEYVACQLDLLAGDAPLNVGNAVCPGGSALNNTANDVSPLSLCASDRYDGSPFDGDPAHNTPPPNPTGPSGVPDMVDWLPGDDCDNVALAVTHFLSASVTATKSAQPSASVGDTVAWTVTLNNGAAGSPASGISVTDTVDANQSVASVVAPVGWTCVISGVAGTTPANNVTCTSNAGTTIAPGGSAVFTVNVTILSSPANSICTDAVTGQFADPLTFSANGSIICLPPNVAMYKDKHPESLTRQNVVNLWLCEPAYNGNFPAPTPNQNPYNPAPPAGVAPCDENGEGRLIIGEMITNVNDPEGLGAYEFQIKFDHKIFDINVTDSGWLYSTGRVPDLGSGVGGCTNSIINENAILFGCVSKNPNPPTIVNGPVGLGLLAQIEILPEPDLKFRLHPGQENGIVRKILDENCEGADIFGDPLANASGNPLPGIVTGGLIEDCDDLDVTVRILEGDLNLDCIVDVLDDQAIAFRYGSFFGSLRYDPWYDLEPALKDFDVDIKDLQKVFGRNGSECSQSGLPADGTIPAQPPVVALSNGPL